MVEPYEEAARRWLASWSPDPSRVKGRAVCPTVGGSGIGQCMALHISSPVIALAAATGLTAQ